MQNKWDKYKKPKWTKVDEFYHYLKLAGILLLTAIYCYLIWF